MLLGHLRTHRNRSAQITYRRDNRHDIKALNPPDIKQVMKTGNNIRHHRQRCCCVPKVPSWETATHPAQVKGQMELLQTHLLESVPERWKLARPQRQRHLSQLPQRLPACTISEGRALVGCEAASTASNAAQMSVRGDFDAAQCCASLYRGNPNATKEQMLQSCTFAPGIRRCRQN